ncbi:MAG: ATP-dependent Clp protease adaptor ClpS, partial [Pseudomonadota bacterium]
MTKEFDEGLDLDLRGEHEVSEPPKYKVLLFNDDYTPME